MIQSQLTLSETALDEFVNDSILTSGRVRACRAELNRLPDGIEWLVHHAGPGEAPPDGNQPRVVLVPEERPDLLGCRLDDAPFYASAEGPTAVVIVGVGQAAGLLTGVYRAGGPLRPLGHVRVASTGLPRRA